jgi:hypothetical protein
VDAVDCVFLDGVEVVQDAGGLPPPLLPRPRPVDAGRAPADLPLRAVPGPDLRVVGFEAAGYYALELEPDHPLLSAASDGGEVGAYHHARRAARIASLRRRIHEFVPLGLRAGVSLAPWEE